MEGVIYHMWSLKALRDKFLGFCYSPIRSVCILTRASWCTCIRPLYQSVNGPGFNIKEKTIRDETPLGWNGAAFAAFGDIVAVFFVGVVAVEPLADSKEGVKLGESTLNRFLLNWKSQVSHCPFHTHRCWVFQLYEYPNLSELFAGFIFCGSWLKAQPFGCAVRSSS